MNRKGEHVGEGEETFVVRVDSFQGWLAAIYRLNAAPIHRLKGRFDGAAWKNKFQSQRICLHYGVDLLLQRRTFLAVDTLLYCLLLSRRVVDALVSHCTSSSEIH